MMVHLLLGLATDEVPGGIELVLRVRLLFWGFRQKVCEASF